MALFRIDIFTPAGLQSSKLVFGERDGPLVKDAHLRSVPEQHDKSIHLAQALAKDFPRLKTDKEFLPTA